jgi:hypothetical protein
MVAPPLLRHRAVKKEANKSTHSIKSSRTNSGEHDSRIITVAARGHLLAAGRRSGKVYIYDLSESPQLIGQFSAKAKLSRLAFVAGQLWVLGKDADWVEVYDVREPSSPSKLGEFSAGAQDYFHARFKGRRAYTFHGKKLRVYGIRTGP